MNRQKHSKARRHSLQFLLWSTLLTALNSYAGDAVRTELLVSPAFDSEIEAVEAMKERCLAESKREDAEHVGAILRTSEGNYVVTHGKSESGDTKVTFAITRPPSTEIVALWHTHGAPGGRTERYSIQDLDIVRETGLPFYLITPKGEIRVAVTTERGKSIIQTVSTEAQRLRKIRGFRGLTLYSVEPADSEAKGVWML